MHLPEVSERSLAHNQSPKADQRDEHIRVCKGEAGQRKNQQQHGMPLPQGDPLLGRDRGHHERQSGRQQRVAEQIGPKHPVSEQPKGKRREHHRGDRCADNHSRTRPQDHARQHHGAERPDDRCHDKHERRSADSGGGARQLRESGNHTMECRGVEPRARGRRKTRRVQRRDVTPFPHPLHDTQVKDRVGLLRERLWSLCEGNEHDPHHSRSDREADIAGPNGIGSGCPARRRAFPTNVAPTQMSTVLVRKNAGLHRRPRNAAATPRTETTLTDKIGATAAAATPRTPMSRAAIHPGPKMTNSATTTTGVAAPTT